MFMYSTNVCVRYQRTTRSASHVSLKPDKSRSSIKNFAASQATESLLVLRHFPAHRPQSHVPTHRRTWTLIIMSLTELHGLGTACACYLLVFGSERVDGTVLEQHLGAPGPTSVPPYVVGVRETAHHGWKSTLQPCRVQALLKCDPDGRGIDEEIESQRLDTRTTIHPRRSVPFSKVSFGIVMFYPRP